MLQYHISGACEVNGTSIISDGDIDEALKGDSMASCDLNNRAWKNNSLESLVNNENAPNVGQVARNSLLSPKDLPTDTVHFKLPSSSTSEEERTASSSKTSSLGSTKGG